MTRVALRHSAATQHALFVVAFLVFLFLALDPLRTESSVDSVTTPHWSGFIQPAFAAATAADDGTPAGTAPAPPAPSEAEAGLKAVVAKKEPLNVEEGQATAPANADADVTAPKAEAVAEGILATKQMKEVTMDTQAEEPIENLAANFNDKSAVEETAAAAATAKGVVSDFLDLTGFSDEDLKTLLSDKKKGQVNFKHYKDRDALIKAIRDVEEKELAQRNFRAEVAAAGRWYTETQEELKHQRASAHRTKTSRIKRKSVVPASLRREDNADTPKHELKIVYNEANGYVRHFNALVKDLENLDAVRLPNLDAFRIVGEPYPVSRQSAIFGQIFQVCFYGVLILGIVPDMVPFIPETARNFLRTRRSLAMSTAFMLNMLGRSVLQNNAFEVYFDGELIYSTMKQSGRLPTPETVSKMLLERTLLKDYAAAMNGKTAAAVLF